MKLSSKLAKMLSTNDPKKKRKTKRKKALKYEL